MMDDVLKKAKEYSFVVGLLEDLYTLLYSQDEEALRSVPIYLDVVLREAMQGRGSPITRKDKKGTS